MFAQRHVFDAMAPLAAAAAAAVAATPLFAAAAAITLRFVEMFEASQRCRQCYCYTPSSTHHKKIFFFTNIAA